MKETATIQYDGEAYEFAMRDWGNLEGVAVEVNLRQDTKDWVGETFTFLATVQGVEEDETNGRCLVHLGLYHDESRLGLQPDAIVKLDMYGDVQSVRVL